MVSVPQGTISAGCCGRPPMTKYFEYGAAICFCDSR